MTTVHAYTVTQQLVGVPVGSIADMVLVTARPTTAEEVNDAFRENAAGGGILGVAQERLVSTEVTGDPRAAVVDTAMTRVVGGTLVKVMSW